MEINVTIEDDSILNMVSEDWLYQSAENILCLADAGESEMGISIVSDERIREINYLYRYIDKITDVISFQMECQDGFVVPDDMRHLGDVIISAPAVVRQAVEYEVSQTEELRRLLIHGILHLLGYDHLQPEQEIHMQSLEERIMCALEERDR
ncbi:MAG: rRNA maturation RNase YbeY [Chloroflexi bacterium]|nr:rRNA maturation RNase YbeY [Chloroflexota bacterium]